MGCHCLNQFKKDLINQMPKHFSQASDHFNLITNMILMIDSLTDGSDGKKCSCNAGDVGSTPGSRRSPGEGNDTHSSGRLQSMRSLRVGHD